MNGINKRRAGFPTRLIRAVGVVLRRDKGAVGAKREEERGMSPVGGCAANRDRDRDRDRKKQERMASRKDRRDSEVKTLMNRMHGIRKTTEDTESTEKGRGAPRR